MEKRWWIYKGLHDPQDDGDPLENLPEPPAWRTFRSENGKDEQRLQERARGFQIGKREIDIINSALYLRRPLLVTGKPGCGKSTLAYAIAYELKLGPVLRWNITTNVTLQEGLYRYDAIGRLEQASLMTRFPSKPELLPIEQLNSKDDHIPEIRFPPKPELPPIGQYLRLGPLGTALLPCKRPRILLIDEIDKSDIDLPNNLLHVFEEGEYEIPELMRLSSEQNEISVMTCESTSVSISGGRVRCAAFPIVILTSNGEREFPPAFLRRCIRLEMSPPNEEKLTRIVEERLGCSTTSRVEGLIRDFIKKRAEGDQATDQLLNALYMITRPEVDEQDIQNVMEALLRPLKPMSLDDETTE